jgi:hypothetical protein
MHCIFSLILKKNKSKEQFFSLILIKNKSKEQLHYLCYPSQETTFNNYKFQHTSKILLDIMHKHTFKYPNIAI